MLKNMTYTDQNTALYNCDCNEFLKTLPDNYVDLVISDPPYGINYKSNRQRVDRKRSVKGEGSINVRECYFDKVEGDSVIEYQWIKEAYRVIKYGSAIYIFAHWSQWASLYNHVEAAGFITNNMIVLNKSNHGMGNLKHFAPKHELLLFASKGKHQLRFPNGRENDIWNVKIKFSGAKKLHPNEKPISWMTPAILNSSDEGMTILDPFMGSGSTGVAALSVGRKFIGCEKDFYYFHVAEDRLSKVQPQMFESK